MTKYKNPDFQSISKEVTDAFSTLRRHGLNLNLSEDLQKTFDNDILFDGDDGLFKSLINNIENYFEYGCGKSTEYMYRHSNCKIYSVDTSKEWVDRIRNVSEKKNEDRLNLNWVDVGEIADWGRPKSYAKRHNFLLYSKWFWESEVSPDLVLIDGRFRVLCFLTSLKFAPVGTKIIFDDYSNRPFYHVAEEFSPILDRCGRQVLFESTQNAKKRITDDLLLSFKNVID
jgi:hypothetical protein